MQAKPVKQVLHGISAVFCKAKTAPMNEYTHCIYGTHANDLLAMDIFYQYSAWA